MSLGDNLFGIKTTYKGIEMRSRLETNIAFFLDCLNIKWEYEPKSFRLSNGMIYIPDFYLTELKMWVEAKGVIEEHNKEISRIFVKDNKTELLLISSDKMFWFSMKDFKDSLAEDNEVYIGKCSKCNSYFFTSNLGIYFCRNCLNHEGDHDLIDSFTSPYRTNKIVFSDIDSIINSLKGVCKNGDGI